MKIAGMAAFMRWPGSDSDIFCLSEASDGWEILMREKPDEELGTSGIMLLMRRFPEKELAQRFLDRFNNAVEYWKENGLV